MLGGPARLIVTTAALVVALWAFPPGPAQAGFPQQITTKVQPESYVAISSSTLPATAKSATMTVKPADESTDRFFANLTTTLSAGRTKGQRVVFCALLYGLAATSTTDDVNSRSADSSLALLFLKACLQIAVNLALKAQPAAHVAAGCPRQDVAVGAKVTRSGGTYRLRLKGRVSRFRGRTPLAITCKRSGNGIKITLKPRKRGVSLRSVAGPKLAVGVLNRGTGKTAKVRARFSVH